MLIKELPAFLAIVATGCMVSPLAAQEQTTIDQVAADDQRTVPLRQVVTQPAPAPPTPRHTGIKAMLGDLVKDVQNLPSRENLFWTGVGGGLALATHPIDSTANAALMGPTWDAFFKPGAVMGQLYVLLPAAATIYVVGRTIDDRRVSHLGSDLIQAELISELMVESLKYTVRRPRPNGGSGYSFPSGHAADTMAFATALERHLDWRFFVPAYAFASYVAMSRLNYNEHYVSDVMFGSAIGIIAGRTVTRTGHEPYPLQAMALPGGFAIVYARRP